MNSSDKVQLIEQVNTIYEVYGKARITPGAAQIWWDTLKEFDHNDIFTILGYWAQSHQKPPLPADVWNEANDKRTDKLERKAAMERVQNRGDVLAMWQGPTKYGRIMMQAIHDMLANPRSQRPWPEKVLDRVRNGENPPYISRKWASEYFAKRDMQQEANEVKP